LNGNRREVSGRRNVPRDPVPIFHVKINDVVPVPPVNSQNAENEEVKNEDESLRQRHIEMNPSRGTIADFIARLNGKSTNANHLGR
jgi:hypothetical protein